MALEGVFSISGSGLELQRAKLDAIAANIANAGVAYAPGTGGPKPLEVVAESNMGSMNFFALLNDSTAINSNLGVSNIHVQERNVEPKRVFDPTHPYADVDGYIEMANIDSVTEMTQLMLAVRAYEANVKAVEAEKAMLSKALELGA